MAFVTVLILFVVVRCRQQILAGSSILRYEQVMNVFDAIGLGAFTVTGIDAGILAGYGEYRFLLAFLGVITGVGGGILRDIMAGETPYILRKQVYASASIAGALLYVLSMPYCNTSIAMVGAALAVVLIRLLAAHYCWNLPTATKK